MNAASKIKIHLAAAVYIRLAACPDLIVATAALYIIWNQSWIPLTKFDIIFSILCSPRRIAKLRYD